jgi:hypothetical protein
MQFFVLLLVAARSTYFNPLVNAMETRPSLPPTNANGAVEPLPTAAGGYYANKFGNADADADENATREQRFAKVRILV